MFDFASMNDMDVTDGNEERIAIFVKGGSTVPLLHSLVYWCEELP